MLTDNLVGNPPGMYMWWVTVADGMVCPDCLMIEAFQPVGGRTLEEWGQRGMPGSGHTVCDQRCRCLLVENEYIEASEEIEVANLKEDKFVYMKPDGEIGQTPPDVQFFKQYLYMVRHAGFTDAEIYRMLYGLNVKEMNSTLYGIIDKMRIDASILKQQRWPRHWTAKVPLPSIG